MPIGRWTTRTGEQRPADLGSDNQRTFRRHRRTASVLRHCSGIGRNLSPDHLRTVCIGPQTPRRLREALDVSVSATKGSTCHQGWP